MPYKSKIMVLAAHPDDEVLGIGGTLIKFKEKYKCTINIEFLTTTPSCDRWRKAKKISEILGSSINRPDCVIDKDMAPLTLEKNLTKTIAEYITKRIDIIKPDFILTHYGNDLNNDHSKISEATLVACRPYLTSHNIKGVFQYEVPSSTEQNLQNIFNPDIFIEIDDLTWDKKVKLIDIYDKEIKDYPHPRSKKGIDTLACYRGVHVGYKRAEALKTMWRKI